MQSSDQKIVFGLSVANIVLSALTILGLILATVILGVASSTLSNPYIYDELMEEVYNDPDVADGLHDLHAYGYDMDADDIAGLVMLSIGGVGVVTGAGALLAVVSLIAGILGVRNYTKPEKLGSAFGWSIAGAITAFICGRWISTVLLVLAAVFIHKVRKDPSGMAYATAQAQIGAAQPGQYAPYGQAPYGYGAPAYGQQPYGAAYANPAPYTQPIPNAQPATQATPVPNAQPTPATPVAPAEPASQTDASATSESASDEPQGADGESR